MASDSESLSPTDFKGTTFDLPPERSRGPAILIIDDEEAMHLRLKLIVERASELASCEIFAAKNLNEARDFVESESIRVAILDKNLGPEVNGIDAIPEILGLKPDLQILVHTGSNDVDDVVSAMKKGAFGYVTKDSEDALIVAQIEKALFHWKILNSKTRLERGEDQAANLDFNFKARAMKNILQKLRYVSETNRPVLLLGEPGVGKTTLAKAIHEYRGQFLKQPGRPFFGVNLTALSPSLIERELFGHEKGAFTGAMNTQKGIFDLADTGTLFIDEIGDVSVDTQTKLLKVIEDGIFTSVGGSKPKRVSFKLVCATNKNLHELVAKGLFKEDFLARISNFEITVPSLRERPEDIPDLIKAMLPKVCKEALVNIAYEEIPDDFIKAIMQNPPRLNVRGLEIMLHHLLTLAPRDSKNVRRFDRWKAMPEFVGLLFRPRAPNKKLGSASVLDPKFEIVDEAFPGLPKFMSLLERKILVEAKEKFQTNRRAASVLKLSEASISLKNRQLGNPREINKGASNIDARSETLS